jgi:hypothetical protein
MTKWIVYRTDLGPLRRKRLVKLGIITAENLSAALLLAFKQWPDELDATKPYAGLTVLKVPSRRPPQKVRHSLRKPRN